MIHNFPALFLIRKPLEIQTREMQILSNKVINKYLTIMKTRPACQNVVYFYALTWLVPKLYIPSIVKTQMRLVLFSSRLVSQASNKISCKFGFQPRTTH